MQASKELNIPTERPAGGAKQEDDIHFTEILAYLFAAKWTILSITAVTLFIAAIQAYRAVPIYHTDAMLKIENQQQGVPGLESASQVFAASSSTQAEVDIIKSRLVIGEAVDDLGLTYHVTPRYYPYFGSALARRYDGKGLAEPFLDLDDYAWGGEVLTLEHFEIFGKLGEISTVWQLIAGEGGNYTLMSEGQKVLSGKAGTSATADYRGSKIVILVSQLTAHPGVSFTISRSSTIAAIDGLRGRINVAQSGERYARSGMVTISMSGADSQAIVNIVNAVAKSYVRTNREGQAKEAEQKLDFIDSQLPALKAKQDQAALELQKFQREAGSVNITLEIENTLTQLDEQKNEAAVLRLQKEELQQNYTEEHPLLKTLTRKIEITEEISQKLEQKLRELPEKEWVYLQKSRDVEASTALYMSMLSTAQELRIAKAGMIGNVRIIDQAVIQPWNVKTGRSRILFIGLLSGLLLGIVWTLLRRMMHRGIEDPMRIERETGLPVFATIPHSDNQQKIASRVTQSGVRRGNRKPMLLANEYDTDMAIEALRSFRTNMRFALKTSENNVVIITGPSPTIGKSFFSSNYAAVSCREGQRVLLIDTDMRKGQLHRNMGTGKSPGLSEVIAGDVTLAEAVHEVSDHFYFLPCGKRPPNPSELLETEAFQNLLEEVNRSFDLVVIDTPPILAVTDASIIAQYGGKLFILLRSGQHDINEILAATSRFEKSGVKVTGILINDQEIQSPGYGYTYGYGYHYKYK